MKPKWSNEGRWTGHEYCICKTFQGWCKIRLRGSRILFPWLPVNISSDRGRAYLKRQSGGASETVVLYLKDRCAANASEHTRLSSNGQHNHSCLTYCSSGSPLQHKLQDIRSALHSENTGLDFHPYRSSSVFRALHYAQGLNSGPPNGRRMCMHYRFPNGFRSDQSKLPIWVWPYSRLHW